MDYLLLNVVFTAIAVALAWPFRKSVSRKIAIPAGLVLLIVTAVFDNVIVASGVVAYEESKILGLRIISAPLEDFGYAIVGVWLIPALWSYFARKTNG